MWIWMDGWMDGWGMGVGGLDVEEDEDGDRGG
jgi:hypothetical protein